MPDPSAPALQRSARTTHTQNPDGSFTARLALRPTAFQAPESLLWHDFDNTLQDIPQERARPGFAQESRAGAFQAAFADGPRAAAGGPLVRFAVGAAAVRLSLAGAHPSQVSANGKTLTYHEPHPGATLQYTLDGDRLKEALVLDRPEALAAFPGTDTAVHIPFTLQLEGLLAGSGPNHTVVFTDPRTGLHPFFMPRPFLLESRSPTPSRAPVAVNLQQPEADAGPVTLELRLNRAWLTDPARVYPVVLDPSLVVLTSQPAESGSKDAWLGEGSPATNHGGEADLRVGRDSGGQLQTLLQFTDLDTLPQDSVISSATLSLYGTGSTTASQAEVHRTTASWNEDTVAWTGSPAYDSAVEASSAATSTGWNSYDVSALVRRWVRADVPNYGVRLISTSASVSQQTFASSSATTASQRPYLLINYVIATRYGLDHHWSYGPPQDYGGGTTSKVNVATGNLVLEHADSSIPARGFDVVLSHTYNSQDPFGSDAEAGTTQSRVYGAGWSFSQSLRLLELDSGNLAEFKDGNGSWRIYRKDSDSGGTRSYLRALYYDYTLTKSLSPSDPSKTWTLTADQGLTKYYFNGSGLLTRIEDRNGNYLTYTWDGSERLTTITDVAGRSATLTYSGPGSPGRLSQITDMAGRVSTYGYDSSGNLTTITHAPNTADVATTTFGYDAAGQLISVQNPRGHTSPVTYQTEGAWNSAAALEGWEARPACGGTTTVSQAATPSFLGGGALKLDVSGMTCGGARKPLTATGALSSTRQELVGFVYAPAGVTTLSAGFYVDDKTGSIVSGPVFPLTAGQWTRIYWADAPVDPTTGMLRLGVSVTASSAYTGSLYVDHVLQRGMTDSQQDALAAHNVVAQYVYSPTTTRTLIKRPDQNGTLQTGTYIYNGQGWLTQMTDALANTASFVYDSSGRLTSSTPPLNWQNQTAATTYAYQGTTSWLQTQTDATGAVFRQGWDTPTGDRRYVIEPTEEYERTQNHTFAATVLVRDNAGNVTGQQSNLYPAGANLDQAPFPAYTQQYRAASFSYYPGTGLVQTVTDPRGNVTTLDYDGGARTKGYLTRVDAPAYQSGGAVRTWTLVRNTDGSLQQETDPTNRVTTYEYDNRGRLKKTNYGVVNGTPTASISRTYDANGNVASQTDGRSHTTTFTYDENNQLITVTDANAKQTHSTYFVSGQRATQVDPDGRETRFTYDAIGRLTQQRLNSGTPSLDRSEIYQYDGRGNRTQVTDKNQAVTSFQYSLRDELTKVSYPVGQGTVDYQYTRSGLRSQLVDGAGTTTYSYTRLRQLDTVTFPGSRTVSYAYDGAGNMTTLSYPNISPYGVRQATYSYDPANQMKTVTDWDAHVTTYSYDDGGRLTSTAYPNTVTTTRSYDQAGRLTLLDTKRGTTVITHHAYTLDGNGNRTQAVETWPRYDLPNGASSSGTSTFTYDALDRLTDSTHPANNYAPAQSLHYTYTDGSNRATYQLCNQNCGATSTMVYDGAGRLTGAGAGQAYYYDYNGNQTSDPHWSYSYNAANRLTQAQASDGEGTTQTSTYTDNGDGLRISKAYSITGGSSTGSTYTQDINRALPVVLVEEPGSTVTYYLYGLDLILGAGYYHHVDAAGNKRALTNALGIPVAGYDYDGFGVMRNGPSSVDTGYNFAGEPKDQQTGLTYLRARYYDPSTGRFTSRDPFAGFATNPQSLNGYAYAENNPVNRTDPSGMCDCDSQRSAHELADAVEQRAADLAVGMRTAEGMAVYAAAAIVATVTNIARDAGQQVMGVVTTATDAGTQVVASRTRSLQNAANNLGIPRRALGDAVERLKRAAGIPANRDVEIDTETGDVRAPSGDIIGNVHDEVEQ